jgi:hypothetical protein
LPLFGLLIGCAATDTDKRPMVIDNPFGFAHAAATTAEPNYAPATTALAARVDQLGRNILAANPQVGLRPLFRTVGSPQAEVFHRGTSEVIITEGLVRQCSTEGQLAAVLCLELGKMVSEREALASPWNRTQEREPMPDVRFNGDNGADRTQLAELAKFSEADRRRSSTPRPLPPDPQQLARTYITNAGFQVADLDAAAPLLKTADGNGALQKQLTPPGPARPWTH